jgi:hypothetical protein
MNMSMCIVIYMNIYINPTNEKLLREYAKDVNNEGNTMSGLINKLLTYHFGAGTPTENTPLPKNSEVSNPADIIDDLFTPEKNSLGASPIPVTSEQACCLNEIQPCRHWVWDVQTGDGYKNSLSGRFMEVE